jgi:hypothetical protein
LVPTPTPLLFRQQLQNPKYGGKLQPRLIVVATILILALNTGGFAATGDPSFVLGDVGFLVVTAAQDTASGFQWVDGPGDSRRSLIWDNGLLNIPNDHSFEGFGAFDLAFSCNGTLGGAGKAGRLLMTDGQYKINEPLLLTDGTVFFFADAGLLEIVATRVRYFAPEVKKSIDPRSSFALLAGLLILIAVLVRRSRRIIKKKIDLP